MGLITDTIRDILKDLPLSAVLKEKAEILQTKCEELEIENGQLKQELKDERRLHQVTKDEHQKLVALHAEEIHFESGIKFKRGKITGGVWRPFLIDDLSANLRGPCKAQSLQ